jgi:hypothetical protein
MRWHTSLLAICAALTFLGEAATQDRGGMNQQNGTINWISDKRKAWDEARRTGKPIWALFR